MASITNNTAFQLNESTKQTIVENTQHQDVEVKFAYSNDENPVFDVYDEYDEYLFSVDTDGDVIFDKKDGF